MITPETWFKNGEALVAANRYGIAEFTEGLELLKKSALAGFTEAQVTLGHGHAQVHLLPSAFQEAARWYQGAANQGHPMAKDRLADLCMLGRGVPQNDAMAFNWYARTTLREQSLGCWAEFAWICELFRRAPQMHAHELALAYLQHVGLISGEFQTTLGNFLTVHAHPALFQQAVSFGGTDYQPALLQ